MDYDALALALHAQHKGKITTTLRDNSVLDREKLSAYYSPGVGAVSRAIAADPATLSTYTWTNNLVAVVSDGSAVLGLGNIGPAAAMPVMEGKSLLFKHFASIDSIPIVLSVHSANAIVDTIKAIAPSFGAINLEDIAAPICFEVEERLKSELTIPVMHDDQHGTAVVTLAGLINACAVTGRRLADCKIALVGAGAAGVAIARLLERYAHPEVIAVDSKGIISPDRTDLNQAKQLLLNYTNHDKIVGTMEDAIRGADVFIGVSQAGLLTPAMIHTMSKNPIIFALANPTPEIMPDLARQAGAAVIATGRSDFANQVNNALAFPGIFRGALDNGVTQITDQHKIAAAETLASLVKNPDAQCIIPSVFTPNLSAKIAAVIK
jgi:malate dehydrogenase (oxaloacetate-decarboxylating)